MKPWRPSFPLRIAHCSFLIVSILDFYCVAPPSVPENRADLAAGILEIKVVPGLRRLLSAILARLQQNLPECGHVLPDLQN